MAPKRGPRERKLILAAVLAAPLGELGLLSFLILMLLAVIIDRPLVGLSVESSEAIIDGGAGTRAAGRSSRARLVSIEGRYGSIGAPLTLVALLFFYFRFLDRGKLGGRQRIRL